MYIVLLVGTQQYPQVRSYSTNMWVGTPLAEVTGWLGSTPVYHLFDQENDVYRSPGRHAAISASAQLFHEHVGWHPLGRGYRLAGLNPRVSRLRPGERY